MKISIKKCILLLVLFCVTLSMSAQSIKLTEFNRNMGRYYKACLYMREGMKMKSPQKFERAMRLIHKDSIQVSEFTPTPVDTLAEDSLTNHLVFDYITAKKLRGEIYVDSGNLKAEPTKFSKEEGRCFVMNRALKEGGKTTYRYSCPAGTNCIAVVCEPRGEIKLSVTSKSGQNIIVKSYEYEAVGFAKWTIDEDDEITFTIENTTNHEVGFAVLAD